MSKCGKGNTVEQVRAVVCYVGQHPSVAMVDGFGGVQAILKLGNGSGHVQRIKMGDYDVLVDDNGRPLGLPLNRKVGPFGQPIVGNFVIGKLRGASMVSLTEVEACAIVSALTADAVGPTYTTGEAVEVGDLVLLRDTNRLALVRSVRPKAMTAVWPSFNMGGPLMCETAPFGPDKVTFICRNKVSGVEAERLRRFADEER